MPITSASFRGQSPESAEPEERAAGKKVTIKTGKGSPNITFKKGGLHQSLNVPADETIPPDKMAAALAGAHGPLAKKQAALAKTLSGMRDDTSPEMPASLAKLPPALRVKALAKKQAAAKKGPAARTLGATAGAILVPTAVLGSNKKKRQGGTK
jgi:hypothetical protein